MSAAAAVRTYGDRLRTLAADLRGDLRTLDDAQAKALFETTAEALGGLANAFDDYVRGDEAAWEEEGQ